MLIDKRMASMRISVAMVVVIESLLAFISQIVGILFMISESMVLPLVMMSMETIFQMQLCIDNVLTTS